VGDLAAGGVGVDVADLRPVAELFDGSGWPPRPAAADGTGGGDVTLVESVGSAVMDAATATHLLERARATDAGTVVEL